MFSEVTQYSCFNQNFVDDWPLIYYRFTSGSTFYRNLQFIRFTILFLPKKITTLQLKKRYHSLYTIVSSRLNLN